MSRLNLFGNHGSLPVVAAPLLFITSVTTSITPTPTPELSANIERGLRSSHSNEPKRKANKLEIVPGLLHLLISEGNSMLNSITEITRTCVQL